MGGLAKHITAIPKTEIHLHIEAAVNSGSYHKLMEKYDIPHDETTNRLTDFSNIESLASMIESFFFVQSFFREPEDFLLVVSDVVDYAKRNNIYYMEAFASPSMILNRGLIPFDAMFEALISGFDAAAKKDGIDVRLIVDVSRSFGPGNAMKNLDLLTAYLKSHPTDRILGVGLGGQEVGNPCTAYKEVFAKARKSGLHVVAHAGEEVGPESIWQAIDDLKAERIGHGTSATQDQKLLDYLKESQLPLEICPTSNVITKKYVSQYSEHPMRAYFDYGINVTVNTDDPILFSIELNQEYLNVANKLSFSKDEITKLVMNNLEATFLTDAEKKKHALRVQKAIAPVKS